MAVGLSAGCSSTRTEAVDGSTPDLPGSVDVPGLPDLPSPQDLVSPQDLASPQDLQSSQDLPGGQVEAGSYDEASCLAATKVPVCDPAASQVTISRATGGPLLAKVTPKSGPCIGASCDKGCEALVVTESPHVPLAPGDTCSLLVTSTDGRSQTVEVSLVANPSPSYWCCGYPLDGRGMWVATNPVIWSPSSILVDFAGDGGATADPCAKCGTNEVCVQSFDGACHGGGITCRTVSEACRNKLRASGRKDCSSNPECQSELCSSPYQCVHNSPCPNEAPEPTLHCYGP